MTTYPSAVRSVVAVLALLPWSALAAETTGVIAVAEPPGPSAELAELTHQFRSVMSERTQGVLDAAKLRERMTGQTSTATLAELDRAYAGALATYQTGDFEGAVRTLRAVVEDLDKLPDSSDAFAQRSRALMRLARAEQTLGHQAEAKAALQRLVRADPAARADPTQYPPSFQRQIDEARAEMKAQPSRKLTVQSTTRGAKVYVEGREVGTAPITVDLAAGRYRVSGAVGQLRVPGVQADLTQEAQTVMLNFTLAEALRPSFGPGLAVPETDRARSLITAGAWLGVDKLVTTTFATEGEVIYLVGSIYDVRRGMLQREGRVRLSNKTAPSGSLSALAGFLITGERSDLVAAVGATPQQVEKRPALQPAQPTGPDLRAPAAPGPAAKSKTLGWVAFGLGVAAVGVGVFAGVSELQAQGKYSDANGLLANGVLKDPSVAGQTKYTQAVKDGDSKNNLAVYTGAGAGGALVLSGILGYIAYKQTGEVGPFRF
jgi:tetratricopeptide (TPR) repeat protein